MSGAEFISLLKSDVAIVAYEGILLIGLIGNSIRLRKKNKKWKEMASLQKDRIREENLDAMLQNERHKEKSQTQEVTNNPYDVVYHEEDVGVYQNTKEHISVQVEEKGVLATKKYVVHVFDQIEIGSDDCNKIVLNDVLVSSHQLQFIRVEHSLFIKNMDPTVAVTLIRQRKAYSLMNDAVQIQNKDQIQVGNTSLRLTMI